MKTILKLALSCLVGASIAACSSSDSGGGTVTDSGKSDTAVGSDDTSGGSDTKTSTDSAGGTDTKTTSDSTPGSDTGGDDTTCGAATSQSTCQKCCNDHHSDSYKAFATTLVTCACKAGNCDTDCASTACAATPATPDSTCAACLAKVQGASGACRADLDACKTADCAPFFTCVADQCTGKPS